MTAQLSPSGRFLFRLLQYFALPFTLIVCAVLGAALLYVKQWLFGALFVALAMLAFVLIRYIAITLRRMAGYRLDLDSSGISATFLARQIPWSAVERIVPSGLNGGTLHVYLRTPDAYLGETTWVTRQFGFMIPASFLKPGAAELTTFIKNVRPGIMQ